jgi:hypothetical protein
MLKIKQVGLMGIVREFAKGRGWGREGGRVSKKERDSGGEKEGGCERKRERERYRERERWSEREGG